MNPMMGQIPPNGQMGMPMMNQGHPGFAQQPNMYGHGQKMPQPQQSFNLDDDIDDASKKNGSQDSNANNGSAVDPKAAKKLKIK